MSSRERGIKKDPIVLFELAATILRLKLIHFRNFIVPFSAKKLPHHYGVIGYGNSGDTVLYREVEKCFNSGFIKKDLHAGEITEQKIRNINSQAKFLVLGGGGLILKDTNSNNNSGWQFNISLENLKKINVPMVVFAIGYNRFKGQPEFDEIFTSHIAETVRKSIFFGLRNHGSIQALKAYLPDELQHKLTFQPCPTTIIKYHAPQYFKNWDLSQQKSKRIAVNIAFDRKENRFKGIESPIIDRISNVLRKYVSEGWEVVFVSHCGVDREIRNYITDEFHFKEITYSTANQILQFYSSFPIVIGMRGHAQMIPFGLGNCIISLISHDKLQWFLDDINHPEWGVDIHSESLESDLDLAISHLIGNFENVRKQIAEAQEKLYQTTLNNLKFIENQTL